MFRIIFDPKVNRFIVQVLQWAILWRTCINQIDGEPMKFETYVEARHWVNSIGLNNLYVEFESKKLYNVS